MDAIVNVRNAELLRDLVFETWKPPRFGMGSPVDVAQTSVMQTLAFVFGIEFLGEMTIEQECAVIGGVKLMTDTLL